MNYVTTRLGRIAYEDSGSGMPVVLLHGAGHDHHDFDAIVPALRRRHRTIALDWPGFGASDPPEGGELCTTLLCDVLEDVLDELQPGPCLLIGNSVGGSAAIRLAAGRPDLVCGLVAVDSAGFTPNSWLAAAICRLQGTRFMRRWTGKAYVRFYLHVQNPHTDAIKQRFAANFRQPTHLNALASLWRSFPSDGSVLRDVPDVKCPTLLVWGRHDPIVRPKVDGRIARRAFPEARYVELESGHVPFAEAPEDFLDTVLPFLDEVEATRRAEGGPRAAQEIS